MFALVHCFLFFTLIILSFGQQQDCYFVDNAGSSEVLDLRSLKDVEITYIGDTYNYTYSICSNHLYCETVFYEDDVYVMVDQYEPDGIHDDECWWLAQWDDIDIKQPTYNPTLKTWTFPPYPGQPCLTQGIDMRTTNLIWNCNASGKYE